MCGSPHMCSLSSCTMLACACFRCRAFRIPCSRYAFISGACQFVHLKCEAAPRGPARQPSVRVEPHKTLGAHGALRPFTVYTVRVDHAHCKRVCVEPVRSCASTTSLASVSVSSLFVLSLRKRVCRSLMFTFRPFVFLIPSPTRSRSYIIRRC